MSALNGILTSAVRLTTPPLSLFAFPPPSEPQALPPLPADELSLQRPFNIDPQTYTNLLSVHYPLTIAAVYATTVSFLNSYNARRRNKPWRVSKTRAFFALVVAHNVVLAAYSAWTCWGMFLALKRTVAVDNGLLGLTDSLCKMSGPRGLSSAVTYDPVAGGWSAGSRAIALLQGKPDPSDVGRLWNEGLAFYGWLFYLSKFYEVVDTLIILAKGKKSSLLQTYHHAGAMLCMWAGIRYMSPPIWMFVLVNSFIHSLMYSYYTVSALGVKVPTRFKRALTTMQITQFLVGVSYALLHLFVEYEVPAEKPYLFVKNMSTALPSVTSSLAAVASAGTGSWLKKLALRAAGEEGAAANILNEQGETFGLDALNAMDVEKAREEIRYKWETATTLCVDTPGQTFAILLNVLYLAPLTYLFVMFFIRSYMKKASKRRPSIHDIQENVRASSIAAAEKVNRAVVRAMSGAQGSYSDFEFAKADSEIDLKKLGYESAEEAKAAIQAYREEAKNWSQSAKDVASEGLTKSQVLARDLAEATRDVISSTTSKIESKAESMTESTKETKTETKMESQPEIRSESKGESKAVPGPKAEAEKETEEESKPQTQSTEAEPQGKIEETASKVAEGAEQAASVVKEELSAEEKRAKELVERAYAAANNAAREADGQHEAKKTASSVASESAPPSAQASAYEASIDEITTEEEKKEEAKMQPDAQVDGKVNGN